MFDVSVDVKSSLCSSSISLSAYSAGSPGAARITESYLSLSLGIICCGSASAHRSLFVFEMIVVLIVLLCLLLVDAVDHRLSFLMDDVHCESIKLLLLSVSSS